MKIFFLSLFSVIAGLVVNAQQNHFIYLQTEDQQPFWVKVDNKLMSSSVTGYVIIPKLQEGIYKLTIGFPKNEWPEEELNCVVENKDDGYLLKNTGKVWGLYNLQTKKLTMPGDIVTKKDNSKITDDPFNNMLANVVNDSTLIQKSDVIEDATDSSKTNGTDITKNTPLKTKKTKKGKPKTDSIQVVTNPINEVVDGPSTITKKISNKTADGTELMYIDEHNDLMDTIRVFIPAEKESTEPVKDEVKNDVPITKKDSLADKPEVLVPSDNTEPKKDVAVTDNTVKEEKDIPKAVMINSDCKAVATDNDFLKLRKKMAAAQNDEDMISAAKKVFKTRCFTTEQVKNLGTLFLKDEGKYLFFESAYPFAFDSELFSTLESQLSDPYYAGRFRAMIKK